MIRLFLLIPSPPESRPRQHLEVEVLLSWLRERDFEAAAFDTAVSRRSPQELLTEAQRGGARLVYWHLPRAGQFRELLRWAEGIDGSPGPALQVAGGAFAQAHDREILERLPQIDAVVRGELESPVLGLLESLRAEDDAWTSCEGITVRTAKGPKRNPLRRPGVDLRTLPRAAADLFHPGRLKQGQEVLLSRGCNSDCRYCGLQTVYRESFPAKSSFWRGREPAAVADEMEHFAREHGVRRFQFHAFVALGYDEAGTALMRGVADELIRRDLRVRFSFMTHPGHLVRNRALLPRLRQAGLARVNLGLDSGSRSVLERFRVPFRLEDSIEALRLLHRHGIPFHPQLIFYEPLMSLGEVGENLAFLRRIAPRFSHLPQPYSLFLCRDLLSRTLRVSRQTPIQVQLRARGLWEPGAPGEAGRTFFRDRRVERFFRGHQTLVEPLLREAGDRLMDPRCCRENPGLALLPLDLLDRWLERVADERDSDEEAAARDLKECAERRLRAAKIIGEPPRVAEARSQHEPSRLESTRRRTA